MTSFDFTSLLVDSASEGKVQTPQSKTFRARVGRFFNRLERECYTVYHHNQTARGYARKRHRALQDQFIDDMDIYYRPMAKRNKLSAITLFQFPEAQMLADEAKHSIATGNFDDAHAKIDMGFEVLRQAGSHRWRDKMADFMRNNPTKRKA